MYLKVAFSIFFQDEMNRFVMIKIISEYQP